MRQPARSLKPDMIMHPNLTIAVSAARAAGRIIMRHFNQVEQLTIKSKSRNDFVSEVDHMAEQEVVGVIRRAYPDHAILAEEGGADGHSDFVWIIDPLDGTTNYLHGLPHFAVSIAMQYRGKIEHAVVYNPWSQELFTASRGQGAQVDGRRIRVSKARALDGSLIGTGFPFRQNQNLDSYLPMLRHVMENTAGIRRAGSAALDLAYVAAGRLDGFWELGLQPWDMAAGMLLISEAGGRITDLADNDADPLKTGNVLAGNQKVFEALATALRPLLR
jgi:myo-inositol-1(or 4)-monophosphatase